MVVLKIVLSMMHEMENICQIMIVFGSGWIYLLNKKPHKKETKFILFKVYEVEGASC